MTAPSESDIRAFRNLKFGLFIHWGIYSVTEGTWKGERIPRLGEQIMRHAKIPQGEYLDLSEQFNPVNYDPDAIVALAKRAGMKYVVLTSKHHDGFCMFHSKLTPHNVVGASAYGKDILEELADACRRGGLALGIYYSNPDWLYPKAYPREVANEYSVHEELSPELADYMCGQLEELLTDYGPVVEIFFDMGQPTPEQSRRLAETVHRTQPSCLASGRIMNDEGDFLTMPDNMMPGAVLDQLWESPGTLSHWTRDKNYNNANNNTWGYKSWIERPPIGENVPAQIRKLSTIVSRGGNFLLNIGPKPDGSILDYEAEILEKIGQWMAVHGEAIHETGVTPIPKLKWGRCTTKPGKLFLHVFDWPADGELRVPGLKTPVEAAYFLNDSQRAALSVRQEGDDTVISDLPGEPVDPWLSIIVVEPAGDLEIADPPPIRPGASGAVELDAWDATINGSYNGMQYNSSSCAKYSHETYDGEGCIESWRRKELTHLTWKFELQEPGSRRVEVRYRTANEETTLSAAAGSAKTAGELPPPQETWGSEELGTLDPLGAGIHTLTLRIEDVRGEKCNLAIKSVRLIPA
jgi:alpha-L-fucosidase